MLPQSDYNVITSGSNGYTADAGYNLVTGLGTPVANVLVTDLVAYQGPARPTPVEKSAPCRIRAREHRSNASGPIDVFSVFDALTVRVDDGRFLRKILVPVSSWIHLWEKLRRPAKPAGKPPNETWKSRARRRLSVGAA